MRDLLWQTAWVIGGFGTAILAPMLANLLLVALTRGWKRTPVLAA